MAKVLFVYSGNSQMGISHAVKNQLLSLEQEGVQVFSYPIRGKGLKGYINNIPGLRKAVKDYGITVIHCHYSLSGFLGALGSRGVPVICSLMGSDVYRGGAFRYVIRFFGSWVWKKTIVKSEAMQSRIKLKKSIVLPNGIDMSKFRPMPKIEAQKILGWSSQHKHILFGGNPDRAVKNYPLAKRAVDKIASFKVQVHFLKDVPNHKVPLMLNASDVLLLTSSSEGSPNIIKEAMACNRPIVSTDVGDVKLLLKGTEGCYIVGSEPDLVKEKIELCLNGPASTHGRDAVAFLDSHTIAKTLMALYQKIGADE